MGLWLGLAVDGGPCGGPGIFGFSEVGRRPRKSEEKRKRGHMHGGMRLHDSDAVGGECRV